MGNSLGKSNAFLENRGLLEKERIRPSLQKMILLLQSKFFPCREGPCSGEVWFKGVNLSLQGREQLNEDLIIRITKYAI